MPIYCLKCDKCEAEQDIYRSIARIDEDLPLCCGETMHRVLTAPFVQTDIQPYKSMVDGSMITSKSQHRDHLKQHGMVEIGNEVNAHMKQEKPKVDREGIRKSIADSIDRLSHN